MKSIKFEHSKDHGIADGGFSLLEVMVAMTVFMIVSGSVFGVLQVAQQSRKAVTNQVQLTKNLRMGLNLIGRDTYNAGYGYPLKNTVILRDNRIANLLTIPADVDPDRDTVPPIIAGNNITLNTFNETAGVRTDQVTFLFKDSTFNLQGSIPGKEVSQPLRINAATTTGTGIDEIVPISGSNANCRVNDLYLITGNTGSTLGVATALSGSNKVQFANGDLLGFNQTGSTGALSTITTPASMMRVKMVTYFVTADGTLTRREYVNVPPPATAAAYVDEPLVYDVENFQITYIMDSGAEVQNPSAGPDGIAGNVDDDETALAAVRQVRLVLSVRTKETDHRGLPLRVSESATFSTRNLGYEAN